MMLREFDLNSYLFNISPEDLEETQRKSIENRLKQEIEEIFYSRNIYRYKN